MRPTTPYFIVKVSIKQEQLKKEKIGSFYVAPSETFMAYNTQCGEITAIGSGAAEYFPQAKIGHMLIMHHFVQGLNTEAAREDHLVHQDDEYRYYVVAAYDHNGKANETYGVWDGSRIIPNKDYVFLKPKTYNQTIKERESGVLVFDEWHESREDKETKMNALKSESQSLAKSGTNKDHIRKGISEKEQEMSKMSVALNKQEYVLYKVAYANPKLSEGFQRTIQEDDQLYVLNLAASTIVEFMGTEYIVTKTKFVAARYTPSGVELTR